MKGEGVVRTAILVGAVAMLASGCNLSRLQSLSTAQPGTSKQILRDGGQLVLPDGTRVTPDPTGGFRLPNGDYVRRDRGALVLPTGARCGETSDGYACP